MTNYYIKDSKLDFVVIVILSAKIADNAFVSSDARLRDLIIKYLFESK